MLARLSIVLLCCFVPVLMYSAEKWFVHHSLVNDVRGGTKGWAEFLATQINAEDDLNTLIERADHSASSVDLLAQRQRVMRVLDAVLHSGSVYQVDVVNAECYCTLVIGSFQWLENGGHRHELDLVHRDVAVVNHSFSGAGNHISSDRSEEQLVVERVRANSVLQGKQPYYAVTLTPIAHQPEVFGSAYFPLVLASGEEVLLRLLIDLREKHASLLGISRPTSFAVTLVIWALIIALYYRSRHIDGKRHQASERAEYLAEFDGLTGVYNRGGYERAAPLLLAKAEAQGRQARILLFDLDNFTEINDFHSYRTGDSVLCAFAHQLQTAFGFEAVVARLGGDEFAVVEILPADQAFEAVRTSGFDLLIREEKKLIDVRVSAGFALFPRDGGDCGAVTQAANLALQANQGDRYEYATAYVPEMSQTFRRRLEEIDAARLALENGELVPHYQPLVDAETGEVEGLEALLRWNHPTRGALPPSEFAAALEDPVILPQITQCMLDQILKDIKSWHAEDLPYFTVGLNISEADLRQPDFPGYFQHKINATGVPAEQITLEVTERAISDVNRHELMPQLDALRDTGALLALDDFGTGHSSITLLKEIPATEIKIDKSFISEITENAPDCAIVRHLVPLAHELGYIVVAEGVETDAQRLLLKKLGVDLIQGWFYSKAVPAADVPQVVRDLHAQHSKNLAKGA
ncbi:MAG: bifunctional diguanylate cyclase/phosphodiesterase [Pseudomonadota bacterium]